MTKEMSVTVYKVESVATMEMNRKDGENLTAKEMTATVQCALQEAKNHLDKFTKKSEDVDFIAFGSDGTIMWLTGDGKVEEIDIELIRQIKIKQAKLECDA